LPNSRWEQNIGSLKGVRSPYYDKKITPNIGIMSVTSQFGPFNNAKYPPRYIFGSY
jgi:hypothetical protein